MKIKPLKLNIPPFKFRSEFETEKLLQKYRVLARKKQIELAKLDAEIPFQPFNMTQYMTPKRQVHVLKVILAYIRYGVSLLKEGFKQLRP